MVFNLTFRSSNLSFWSCPSFPWLHFLPPCMTEYAGKIVRSVFHCVFECPSALQLFPPKKTSSTMHHKKLLHTASTHQLCLQGSPSLVEIGAELVAVEALETQAGLRIGTSMHVLKFISHVSAKKNTWVTVPACIRLGWYISAGTASSYKVPLDKSEENCLKSLSPCTRRCMTKTPPEDKAKVPMTSASKSGGGISVYCG